MECFYRLVAYGNHTKHCLYNTVLLVYNGDGGVSRVDHVIAKPPYNDGTFNVESYPVGTKGLPYVISESNL